MDRARFLVTVENALRKLAFHRGIEKRILTYLAQIHLHGIVVAVRTAVLQFLLLQDILRRSILEHPSPFQNIDACGLEFLVHIFEDEDIALDLRELAEDLVVGDVAALAAQDDERLHPLLLLRARRTFRGSASIEILRSFARVCRLRPCFLSSAARLCAHRLALRTSP